MHIKNFKNIVLFSIRKLITIKCELELGHKLFFLFFPFCPTLFRLQLSIFQVKPATQRSPPPVSATTRVTTSVATTRSTNTATKIVNQQQTSQRLSISTIAHGIPSTCFCFFFHFFNFCVNCEIILLYKQKSIRI